MSNSGEKPGFIIPPPGLIPSRDTEEAAPPPPPISPVSFPGFVPMPLGVTLPVATPSNATPPVATPSNATPPGAAPPVTSLPVTALPTAALPSTALPATTLPGTILFGATVPSAAQSDDDSPGAHAPAASAAVKRPRNVLPQEDTLIPKMWRLTLADGQSFEATTSMVLGRDPAPVPVRPQAKRIAVTDPAKSVSKTHAIIDLEAAELSVTDLHSTNGVIVTRPDGRQDDLPPGGRTVLTAGSRVLLGEFTIDITRE